MLSLLDILRPFLWLHQLAAVVRMRISSRHSTRTHVIAADTDMVLAWF